MSGLDLVALPFAGSHMDPFLALRRRAEEHLPGLTSTTVTYPGHGKRIGEPALTSIPEVAADALDRVLARQADGPRDVVLLGYSMGCLVAYELYFLLRANGIEVPQAIFMASTPPPKVKGTDVQIESDDELLEHCGQYGLISPADFPSPQLRALFLPALRRDIQAVDRYPGAVRGTRVLDPGTEVAVFTGRQDATVQYAEHWRDICPGEPAAYAFDGGHFFLNERRDEVVDAVLSVLSAERVAAVS
ncbi:MAG: alpha/beta fold hydrolase [Dermatophilaceae bacterium]